MTQTNEFGRNTVECICLEISLQSESLNFGHINDVNPAQQPGASTPLKHGRSLRPEKNRGYIVNIESKLDVGLFYKKNQIFSKFIGTCYITSSL